MTVPGDPQTPASDHATVRPTSGPAPLSDGEIEEVPVDLTVDPAPAQMGPQPGSDEEASVTESFKQAREFDPAYRDNFFGLLHIGSLSVQFYWLGHEIVIRTLNTEELLVVALLTKEWDETIGASKAYQTAWVCMAVQTVDGQPLPEPMGEQQAIDRGRKRFQYALQWFAPTIDYIYTQCLALDNEVQGVVAEMGNSFG